MKWTVVWIRAVQNDLADLWMAAPDRKVVEDAANWIDQALARDPQGLGIHAADGWFLERLPLTVSYEVIPDDCMVRVLQVVRSDETT